MSSRDPIAVLCCGLVLWITNAATADLVLSRGTASLQLSSDGAANAGWRIGDLLFDVGQSYRLEVDGKQVDLSGGKFSFDGHVLDYHFDRFTLSFLFLLGSGDDHMALTTAMRITNKSAGSLDIALYQDNRTPATPDGAKSAAWTGVGPVQPPGNGWLVDSVFSATDMSGFAILADDPAAGSFALRESSLIGSPTAWTASWRATVEKDFSMSSTHWLRPDSRSFTSAPAPTASLLLLLGIAGLAVIRCRPPRSSSETH